jgi:hypothetical protein
VSDEQQLDIEMMKRRYLNIIFENFKFINENYRPIRSQMATVRKLEFNSTNISATSFVRLLNTFSCLEELLITNKSSIISSTKTIRVPLPTLKSLIATSHGTHAFLKFIGKTPLKQLTLDSIGSDIIRFLELQSDIEDLSVKIRDRELATSLIAIKAIKLKRLAISVGSNLNDLVLNLLQSHTATLKELKIKIRHAAPEIYKHIFQTMKLETLMIQHIPRSDAIYEKPYQNTHLKKLVIRENMIDMQSHRFLLTFPALLHLKLEDCYQLRTRALALILNSLSSLQHLHLTGVCDKMNVIEHDALKYLHFDNICGVVHLNLPNLEHLSIGSCTLLFFNEGLEIICQLPNLRTLSMLTKKFWLSETHIDDIKIKCPKFRELRLFKNPAKEQLIDRVTKETNLRVIQYTTFGYMEHESQDETEFIEGSSDSLSEESEEDDVEMPDDGHHIEIDDFDHDEPMSELSDNISEESWSYSSDNESNRSNNSGIMAEPTFGFVDIIKLVFP